MLDILTTFSSLTVIACALTSLLPDGSLKKTALLCTGILLTLCWVEGLRSALSLPDLPSASAGVFTVTDTSLHALEEKLLAEVSAAP